VEQNSFAPGTTQHSWQSGIDCEWQ